jgi:hypothetical protein
VVCLILSVLVSLRSVQEAVALPRLAEMREGLTTSKLPFVQNAEAAKAFVDAQLRAVEPMRETRTLILIALTFASSLCFVAAARFLRPGPLSREAMQRLLARTALATAVLRTLDGAQQAVVARNAARLAGRALLEAQGASEEAIAAAAPLVSPMMVGMAVVLTVILVGSYTFFFQFFSRETARA